MHDGFSPYDQYRQCRHARCNAHLLRELNYVIETSKAEWATGMKALLLVIKAALDKAREVGSKGLAPRRKQRWLKKYQGLIEQAKKLYGTLRR